MCLNSTKCLIRKLFLEGVSSVRPDKLISGLLRVDENDIIINSRKYSLNKGKCYVVGFGKAVTDMAFKVETILKDKLHKGILSIPHGLDVKNEDQSKFKIYRGGLNNLPDEDSLKATEEIIKLAEEATADDLVLLLISGGGSALLAKPKSGITLDEKKSLINALAKSGADIKELNCVRKRISDVKGGKLIKYIYPAQTVSLILSDIVGDPLDLIASGSSVRNTEPTTKALDILKKYNLLSSKLENIIKEEIDLDNYIFANVNNTIIANNRVALEGVKKEAMNNGYTPILLSSCIEANVELLSKLYAQLAYLSLGNEYRLSEDQIKTCRLILKQLGINEDEVSNVLNILSSDIKRICFLVGGETVVIVRGKGLGGRNQELALRFSIEFDEFLKHGLSSEKKLMFLSGGTDGMDGPTDAAGALTYHGQSLKGLKQGLDPLLYLNNNDSYNYFKQLDSSEDLLKVGHTGVNVMDLHIFLIER